jgi:hypothetical protein
MSSIRKKYRPENADTQDAPVQTAPGVAPSAESSPPAADAAPLPEQPGKEPDAVKQAEQNAIAQRIAEMDRAEGLVREHVQRQPQFATERPKPQQAPPMPAHVQAWIDAHPEYFNDHVKHAELALATAKCTRDGLGWDHAEFVPTVERHLGLRQEARPNGNGHDRSPAMPAPAARRNPSRQQHYGGPTVPVSAPPSNNPPSWSSGRPSNSHAPLTQAEREIAAASGVSEDVYLEQRNRMNHLKKMGVISDGR